MVTIFSKCVTPGIFKPYGERPFINIKLYIYIAFILYCKYKTSLCEKYKDENVNVCTIT